MNQQVLGTIHQVFSKLGIGFNADHRAIGLKLNDPVLNQQVYLHYISGYSAINSGLNLQLICLSTDAHIALSRFIGQTALVEQTTDQGLIHSTSGIITQAVQGSQDGGFAVYKLTLQDSFSSLMPKRCNSRVFMQKSVLDITRILFEEWAQKSPLFAKSIQLDHSLLKQNDDIRPFTMQSQESDFDFLTRLWRSEGINWFIDQTQQPATQQHRIVLFNDSKALAQLDTPNLYLQRSDATQQQDSITQLISHQQLQSTQAHVQRWSQQHGSMDEQQTISNVQQSTAYAPATLKLEQAWHVGAAALGDLNGQDTSTPPSDQQMVRLGELLIKRQELQTKSVTAIGTVRTAKVGYWFNLTARHDTRLPSSEGNKLEASKFLITELSCYACNNLPKEINARVLALIEESQWPLPHDQQLITPPTQSYQIDQRHQVKLTLVQRDVAIVPFYDPQRHTAKAQPMRARVVGADGETVHVDAWGRVKVQFLFSRPEDNTHSGGAGSSSTDSDSAWIDVLTPWAGADEASYGTRFLPRVGEMVVVDFFDGNADQPFVVGRIHESNRLPSQFDQQGTLPDIRALSGIKSQEVAGTGFNQLRLDDSTGQINAQLASSHGTSQLNLGNLVHPRKSEEGKPRGEGFELRTDQFGALRAGQGLLLSTHDQAQAVADHLQAEQAKSQLEGSLNQSTTLSNLAKNQQTDPLDGLDKLKTFLEQIGQQDDGKAAAFKQALMLLASPQSIALSSQKDIHISSDGQLTQTAGDSINLSSQKNIIAHAGQKISLFAAGQGIQAIAAKSKLELQAQADGIEVIARKVIKFISTEERIEITSPKEIVINASGSQLKINSGGVFSTTGAKFESKAGQHVFSGGGNLANVPLNLPKMECDVKGLQESSTGKVMIDV